MNAIRFTAKENKLELTNIPIPTITHPDDVLIKVAYSGVCGTDLHVIKGEFPFDYPTITLGHEFSGTIVDVGTAVKYLKKGDNVAVDPNTGCDCCDFCHSGNPHYCLAGGINENKNGGWAHYAKFPQSQVHKIPDNVSLEQAALTEPLSCLARGWDIVSPITVGSNILIIGAGIIGNLWACLLHLHGHRKVTVSEPNQMRLELIEKLNTSYTLITPNQLKQNQERDPTYLFDVVIDCSGYPPAIEHAFSLLQMGGKLCCFGCAPQNGKITLKPFDIITKQVKIFGVHINPLTFPKALGLLEAFGDRYLDYSNLGIKIFDLSDYNAALDQMKQGAISKAIFKI